MAVVHFPPLRLETNVSLRRTRIGPFIHQLAVQHHPYLPVLARDFAPVPVTKRNPILHDDTAACPRDAASADSKKAACFTKMALHLERSRPALHNRAGVNEEARIRPAFIFRLRHPAFLLEPPFPP